MGSKQDLHLAQPLPLKCGLTLPNRLVKAAMAENLASKDGSGLPTDERLLSAYRSWAQGGWGMILTGNVQVDRRYLGSPGDVYVDAPSLAADPATKASVLSAFEKYAQAAKPTSSPSSSNGQLERAAVIVQINHPGRQSPLGSGSRPFLSKNLAPSAVPLTLGSSSPLAYLLTKLIFGTPRELTIPEINDIISRFAQTSLFLAEAGFDGVEIHAAHGYLLSQFLSSRSNKRNDEYGGSPAKRAKIVVEIIRSIRETLAKDGRFPNFAVGIKINSADVQSEGEEGLQECIQQLELIVAEGVDFVEVSGGSYDDPRMFADSGSTTNDTSSSSAPDKKPAQEQGVVSESTAKREAFFQTYCAAIRPTLQVSSSSSSSSSGSETPLMLTGGFRTRNGMETALSQKDCDMVGLGRPAVINPHLPINTILNAEVSDKDAIAYAKKVPIPGWIGSVVRKILPRVIGAGYETAWYGERIKDVGFDGPSSDKAEQKNGGGAGVYGLPGLTK